MPIRRENRDHKYYWLGIRYYTLQDFPALVARKGLSGVRLRSDSQLGRFK